MNDRPAGENHVRRCQATAEWYIRLQEDDVSDAVLAEWSRWCEEPENLKEFQAMGRIWRDARKIDRCAKTNANRLRSAPEPRSRLKSSKAQALRWLSVACGIAIVASWFTLHDGVYSGTTLYRVESTIRSQNLPDGSIVVLAPRSALSVDFSGAMRELTLNEGEAYFKVRPDHLKPFVVHTHGLKITAVGTAFDVRSQSGQVVVTVADGVVEVNRLLISADGPTRVGRGYRITYDTADGKSVLAASDSPGSEPAWCRGRLEYVSTDLSTVVADIRRYSSVTIEIGDRRLGRLRYTGTVDMRRIDDWVKGIEAAFSIRAVPAKDGHLIFLNQPQHTEHPAH
jgi:transmembrane sensor